MNLASAHAPSLRPTRLGLALFTVYVALYVAFVGALLFPQPADDGTQTGMPYPVVGGFGLIGAAWLLAVIYAFGTKADLTVSEQGGC